jgi:thioredoxin 1
MKDVNGKEQWQNEVINSDKPVFVDFWAEWCGPCRIVSPTIEELSKEYEGKVDFVKVNVDQNNELASKYNVFSIPTLAIFSNGKVIAQSAGAAPKEKIRSYIDKHVLAN